MNTDKPVAATAADTATYIEKVAGELAKLSAEAGMPFLAYLLSMAREEAAGKKLQLSVVDSKSEAG